MVYVERTLQPGDLLPHFEIRTVGGDLFSYSTIWQRKNLVLVTLPAGGGEAYASTLAARRADFDAYATTCIITREGVSGVPAPAALVADRWGEVVHVAVASDVAELPAATELAEWVDYVERRCPECESEAK